MEDFVKIKKSDLIEVLWGICLADNLRDIWREVNILTDPLGIERDLYGDDLLKKMEEMDFIPDYQRESI